MTARNAHAPRGVTLLFVLAMTLVSVYASADVPALARDGWHSWQVDAVDGAPRWCCQALNASTAGGERSCDLDARNGAYRDGDRAPTSGRVRVYVHVRHGEAVEVRALDASCPVTANRDIRDHGTVTTDDSARWLMAQVRADGAAARGALPALALHAGEVSTRALRRFADRGPALGLRKDAVFWIGQLRAATMRADLRRYLFDDADPMLREHAAFVWSRTQFADRGDALIELAGADGSSRVRGQAWFWLARTGDARTEAAIGEALRNEDSAKVREQAVFALSQLGDGRSAAALIEVIEDRALAPRDRERAVFWLAQDESRRAREYLARVLD